jgi:mannose-6-phosphate isomerase-like protein (cupin superfamily)
MIKKADKLSINIKDAMRGEPGTVKLTGIASQAELLDQARLFSKITLEPGCGIGYHIHENETEIFYIIKGDALYSDNGSEKYISAGDVTITPDGEGHSITNRSDETLELIALIVLK